MSRLHTFEKSNRKTFSKEAHYNQERLLFKISANETHLFMLLHDKGV